MSIPVNNTSSQQAIATAELQAQAALNESVLQQDDQVETQIMNNINPQDHTVIATPEQSNQNQLTSNKSEITAEASAVAKRRALRIGTSSQII
jgi:hypothetical protein